MNSWNMQIGLKPRFCKSESSEEKNPFPLLSSDQREHWLNYSYRHVETSLKSQKQYILYTTRQIRIPKVQSHQYSIRNTVILSYIVTLMNLVIKSSSTVQSKILPLQWPIPKIISGGINSFTCDYLIQLLWWVTLLLTTFKNPVPPLLGN